MSLMMKDKDGQPIPEVVDEKDLKRPGRSKKLARRGIFVLVLLLIVGLAARAYSAGLGKESTEDANLEGHVSQIAPRVGGQVLKVLVEDNQTVKKGDLLFVIDPADYRLKVRSARAALLSAERRYHAATARSAVTQLTTNASLNGAEANQQMGIASISKAQSSVESAIGVRDAASSRVELARAQVATSQRNYEQARSQARATKVEVVRAQQDLRRAKELVAEEAVPDETLDHAKAAYDAAVAQSQAAQERVLSVQSQVSEARASLSAAQQQLAQSQAQISMAQAQVRESQAQSRDYASRVESARSAPHQVQAVKYDRDTARAEIDSAQAALEQAELNLSYTEVRASMDGRVSKREVEPGDYLQPGQAVISEVSTEKWVVANFKETQLTSMSEGQKAVVWVDAYPGVAFHAHVDSLQPGSGSRFSLLPPENASGNWVKVVQRVPVKLVFDEVPQGNYHLEPGMSVEAEVEVGQK